MLLNKDKVEELYSSLEGSHQFFREKLGRGLTYAEKILLSHLVNKDQNLERGKAYIETNPDRVAMQDATAQMACLQFMLAGKKQVAVPTTVHCWCK